MSRVAIGSIPEKICYISLEEREFFVGCEWDIDWHNNNNSLPSCPRIKVLPTFIADNADDKMLKRVAAVAEGYYKPKRNTSFNIVDNTPIRNVKVVSANQIYNAVIINNYCVDLQVDVVMDTILQVGIDPGGILKGEYIWAKMGSSQMKLIRVGSELHRLIVEFESKKDIKMIGKKNLEVGGVYQDRRKNQAIFLGYVNTTRYNTLSISKTEFFQNKNYEFKYEMRAIKKAMLFYEVSACDSLEDSIKKIKTDLPSYSYPIKKSHKYIEKIDQVDIPNDIIEYLRNKFIRKIKEKIVEYANHKAAGNRNAISYLKYEIENQSNYLNLYRFGGEVVEPFDIKKYLIFS